LKKQNDWRKRDPRFGDESSRYEDPIPSRDYLGELLAEAGRPLGFEDLARQAGLRSPVHRRALQKRLAAMVRDGQLILNRAEEYCLIARLPLVVGTVSGHRDGFGFLLAEDGGGDIFLAYRQMRRVFPGDRAAVRVTGVDAKGRREGALAEVLEHRTRQLAGRFSFEAGVGFVQPDNPRIQHRVVIPASARGGARSGDLVVAGIVEQPTDRAEPVGRILRVLPEVSTAATAVELAIAAHGLPDAFEPAVVREARKFGKVVSAEDAAGREDLRGLPLVTIDGEDARDFDDAVFAERSRGGYRLLVAIADVSHYVRPHTALDVSARERATSVYFPGRVLPMLPEDLSNRLCSLMPKVDRLCMACEMRVTARGKVTAARFFPAVMRSAARLTYTQVGQALAEPPQSGSELGEVMPVIAVLHEVYLALREAREARGALDFDAPEVKVILAADGKVEDIRAYPRNDAHRLIEECMIAANVEAARFLRSKGLPTLFRIHGKPEEDRISDLKRFLAQRGVHLETGHEFEPARLRKVLVAVSGRPDAAVLESAIIRSLPQALYQPLNIGHFGLALAEYAHFTSPIRRYPDLLVHRAIRHALLGGTVDDFVHPRREMEQLGQECSMRERRADEAARSVVALLKCEFMKERIGEEFDAVITGVTDFGVFVQLTAWQVDGLVHVTALGSDYFHFHEDERSLRGDRSGLRFTIGDPLRVRLTRVDPAERKIDFELVGGAASAPRRRGGRRGGRK
jgi:ribonuclease R